MTPLQIAKQLRRVAKAMVALGVAMDYHGGFSEIGRHGRELVNAGLIAKEWAKGIEADRTATGASLPASDSCSDEDSASPCALKPAPPAESDTHARTTS